MIEHSYPSNYPPDHPRWSIRLAWAILDRIRPGAMEQDHRSFLSGMIAGAIEKAYELGKAGTDPEQHPLLEDRPARK